MANRPYESGEMAEGEPASELASPWVRLAAWITDALIYFAVATAASIVLLISTGTELILLPLALMTSFLFLLLLLASMLVIFIAQLVLLTTRGQTVGKIIMKIRVVDAQTGAHPGGTRLILLRTVTVWGIVSWIILIQIIPPFAGLFMDFAVLTIGLWIGCAYWLADSLFIFRADHRTVHDLIADTRVDKVAD